MPCLQSLDTYYGVVSRQPRNTLFYLLTIILRYFNHCSLSFSPITVDFCTYKLKFCCIFLYCYHTHIFVTDYHISDCVVVGLYLSYCNLKLYYILSLRQEIQKVVEQIVWCLEIYQLKPQGMHYEAVILNADMTLIVYNIVYQVQYQHRTQSCCHV